MTTNDMDALKSTGLLRWLPLFLVAVVCGCTTDNYESGDGEYSYLTSAFSMLKTNSTGRAVSFVTDDNKEYTLQEPVSILGTEADTVYRVLAYYNETATKSTTLRGIKPVYVLIPQIAGGSYNIKNDPVVLNSVWTSANGAYLNLGMSVMEGVADSGKTTSQVLGMVISQDHQTPDARYKSYTLTLVHDQNGVPEYYKTAVYASVPLDGFNHCDTLNLLVNTYNGVLGKTVVVP